MSTISRYTDTVMSIAENLRKVREDLAEAARKASRDPAEIELMAVSKNHPREAVEQAYEAGQRLFGENRVQEGSEKFSLPLEGAAVHLIGHLQSNKAKAAAEAFDWVQSVDKAKTARALAKYVDPPRTLSVLIEMNTSGEDSKNGARTEDAVWRLIDDILELPTLRIRGFMTLAAFVDDETIVRNCFRKLYEMREKARSRYPVVDFETLSMGMSDDFRWAIQEGSTLIRVGTAIFGRRA